MKRIMLSLAILFPLFMFVNPVSADDWQLEDEIIYEIIVDRYNNGDFSLDTEVDTDDPKAYHGGDLIGIRKRLDEKAELGITMLALSPIMKNASGGFHGYWVEDFTDIEEQFGTFSDLEELVNEAHERDMKVVLEFVTNYVPKDHPLAIQPDYSDWILTENVTGPDWTENVVQLNQDHPEVQEFLIESAAFWLEETDVDGLIFHAVDQSSVDFLAKLTTELKDEFPDKYLIGDVLDPQADIEEIVKSTKLDGIDDYALGQAIADVFSAPDQSPVEIFDVFEASSDMNSLIFVDDKYSKRFTQRVSENGRNSVTSWQLTLTMMYTMPGNPLLLQGSELSMYGETAEDSQRLVPLHSGEPELKEFHNRISSLRSEFPALRYGDIEIVDARDSFVVFKRSYEGETLYIAINNGSESSYIDIPGVGSDNMLRGYLGDNIVRVNEEGNHRVGIPRETIEVYEVVDYQGINWLLISLVVGVMIIFVGAVIYLTLKQKKRERVAALKK